MSVAYHNEKINTTVLYCNIRKISFLPSSFMTHYSVKRLLKDQAEKKLNSAFYSAFGNFVIIPLFIRQQHFKGRNHRSLPNHKTIFQKIHSTSKIKTLASSIFAVNCRTWFRTFSKFATSIFEVFLQYFIRYGFCASYFLI